MKLATYSAAGRDSIAAVVGDQLVDLPDADSRIPRDMIEFLIGGVPLLDAAQRAVTAHHAVRMPLDRVHLLAPVPRPRKFLAIGLNYERHVQEAERRGVPRPTRQLWFNKQVTCINGPFDPIVLPRVSEQLDYEAELAVVIGTRCRHVRAAEAGDVIAGYMVCNDVSVRDWQRHTPTWTMGKSFDTHGPIGPWLVTPDELPDPSSLVVRCFVNDELRQEASTSEFIYGIPQMIEYLSTAFTLEPGDVLATGTPSGVGSAMNPPHWLRPGDVVRCEVDGIGAIEAAIVAEPPGDSA